MSKRLKALVVDQLQSGFAGLDRCVIVSLTGVTAISADKIRAQLEGKNARLRIVKNTLAAIALKEIGLAGIERLLVGPSALVTGGADIVDLAKMAGEMSNAQEGVVVVKGGFGEGKVLSPRDIETLSKVPARPELLSILAGTLAGRMRDCAGVLGAVQRKFLYAVTALKDKSSAAA